jgi:hypothetical protein
LTLAAAGTAGAIAYVAVLVGLRADELSQLRDAVRRRRPTADPSTVGP